MYIYLQTEPAVWTVGFYDPDGKFHSESDHSTAAEAAIRTAWLNGATAARSEGLAAGKIEKQI